MSGTEGCTTKTRSVPKQCENLEGSIETLASTVNGLQSRLTSILKTEPEGNSPVAGGFAGVDSVECPLADQLCGIKLRIEQQIENINRIVVRLEI